MHAAPAYRWTDPYPYYSNPMHYAPSDDSRAKESSSHMKMDPSTMNSPYQPWPYGGNYCYPASQECHGCYNHGYFGGPYSFRPPYPHYPPPPPFHTHGFYPPFPGAYPAYSVPPPHYSVEQPRYDYDKNTHGSHHCCGCNPLVDEKKSSIEREEPGVDKKTSDSLVPFLLKDYPYPIMWVPPGFMNGESKAKEKDKYSYDPVSLKPLVPSKRGGSDETDRDQPSGDGNRLPFPIFWFPSKNNEVGEDTKEKDLDLVTHKGSPFSGSDHKGSGSEAESETSSKHAVQKVIPVKQLGTEEGNKSLKSAETKVKSTGKTDDGMEGKASPKASKLPPVCLRIDPLPRRKNGSRSPSPPGDKGISKRSPMDNSKSSQQQTQLSEGLKKSKEDQSKDNIKTIEATPMDNSKSSQEQTQLSGDLKKTKEEQSKDNIKPIEVTTMDNSKSPRQQTQLSEGLKKSEEEQNKGNIKTIEVTDDANKVERESLAGPCENVPRGEENESGKGGEPLKSEKKNLSEHEAALIIQSACRGFEVRKSKPITKLKQIAGVGKEVVELRNRIQDLESSSSSICIDDKQKLIIGETIMSLLLKLDTIQGLHPMVRDVRKSVAKELVDLQEKLDSLTFGKSETPREKSDQGEAHSNSNVKLVESGTGLCENLEVEPRESQDDDGGAEARDANLEPQVELQNEKSREEHNDNQLQLHLQARAQSDSNGEAVCESGATDSEDDGGIKVDDIKPEQPVDDGGAEACDANLGPQVELQNEQNQLQVSVEREQPPDDVIQDRFDQARAQSESKGEAVREIGAIDSEDDGGIKVEAKESEDDGDEVLEVVSPALVEVEKDVSMVEKDDSVKGIQEDLDVVAEEAPKADDVDSPPEKEMLMADRPLLPVSGGDRKLMEENEKLRGAVEELMKAGKEQVGVIKELTGRVKDLEKKLSKKKKRKVKKCRSRGCGVEEELRSGLV